MLCASSTTGLTTTLPDPFGAITALAMHPLAYVS
jgi:hypothetical protein